MRQRRVRRKFRPNLAQIRRAQCCAPGAPPWSATTGHPLEFARRRAAFAFDQRRFGEILVSSNVKTTCGWSITITKGTTPCSAHPTCRVSRSAADLDHLFGGMCTRLRDARQFSWLGRRRSPGCTFPCAMYERHHVHPSDEKKAGAPPRSNLPGTWARACWYGKCKPHQTQFLPRSLPIGEQLALHEQQIRNGRRITQACR